MSLLPAMQKQFAIPVIRENDAAALEATCMALADGGLTILEITLMHESAYEVIKKLSKEKDLIIGAGTVLNAQQSVRAIDCGAQFLVSPGLNKESVAAAMAQSMPFFPGVLTPSEIILALQLNCEMLKVFPVTAVGGVDYIKSLQGPFPGAKWMATGEVTIKDIRPFLKSGVNCVGIGSQLTPADKIRSKEWNFLKQSAAECVAEVKSGRSHEKL
jgi:2-dehydro-3-deoxyphosphogluconate aldolase/(4S)-4-hydroxy-2-oxoglutarate aldolase